VVGFNTAKISSYGDQFLGAIIRFCVDEKLETDQFPTVQEMDDNLSLMGAPPTVQTSYQMYKEGKSVAQIAQERGMAATTIMGHLGTCLEKGADVNLEKLGVTPKVVAAVASVVWESPINSDVSRLGPVKEELVKNDREDIDWGMLKMAVTTLKLEHGVTDEGILKWDKTDFLNYGGKEMEPEVARYIPQKFTGDKFGPSKIMSKHTYRQEIDKKNQERAAMEKTNNEEEQKFARNKALQDELDEYEALQDEINLGSKEKENSLKIAAACLKESNQASTNWDQTDNKNDFKSKLAEFKASEDITPGAANGNSSSRATAGSAPPFPAVKRKKELPAWMSSSQGKTEMAQKKMKTNSLFK